MAVRKTINKIRSLNFGRGVPGLCGMVLLPLGVSFLIGWPWALIVGAGLLFLVDSRL